ncbi:3-hydroxyisobutyrate dehydrogenase [Aureimonas altamirensis]|nr:3-hydroxyisobutyrate dehydrogenase [Aureimonas altamirensis]MCM2504192.1 3-hydroxyisobutyrate dehydrogenase [Aureimonas altamirensis]
MTMRIAFVGLGNMGLPMALNLKAAGHAVTGFDLAEGARAAAQAAGLSLAAGLADAVADAGAVITMLPAGRHVTGVWADLTSLAAPGTLLVDCSTIDVGSAREAHAMAGAAGMPSLDAPVSGGTVGAEAATLTLMCGGSDQAFSAAHPVLACMGKRIVHCGAAGAGQAAKICNNMILGISMIGVAEAFVLAEKLGLSHQALFDVASTSSGQCWSLTTYCPVPGPVPGSPANREYRPGFAAALMLKDLGLAREAAEASGSATPLGRHAQEIYEAFEAAGGGGEDFSAVIKYLRNR